MSYIDKDEAINVLCAALYAYEDEMEKQFIESDECDVGDWIEHRVFVQRMSEIDRKTISEIPSADVEPVRHRKWKRSKYYPHIIFCDECGEPYELSNSMEHWNYCPNCGVKMDKADGERKE